MNVEKEHRKIISLSITIAIFLLLIFGAAYAIINQSISYNTENVTTTLGTRPVFTSTATNSILMSDIPYIATTSSNEFEIANASDTLSLSLSTNYSTNTTCTYDVIWEWNTTDSGYTKTSGATKEFTVSGSSNDSQSFSEVQLNNYNANSLRTVLKSGATITAVGSTITTQTWTVTAHFYKTQAIQSNHKGKSYPGKVLIDNVVCSNTGGGTVASSQTLIDFLVNDAPKSGTNNVTNSSWILTSDRTGEWRYAGKNPDNYILFNNELWRIIGVMPNMEYCTGTYTDSTCSDTATGSLVKIVRNDSEGNLQWDDGSYYAYDIMPSNTIGATFLKNDIDGSIAVSDPGSAGFSNWYHSSLKNMLQSRSYASITNVAVANWSLYNASGASSALNIYNSERNINNTGSVYSGNPTYWYGKVGLIYPSDYAYATSGSYSNLSRSDCLEISPTIPAGDWATYCVSLDWLAYNGITSTNSGSISEMWCLTPTSSDNIAWLSSNKLTGDIVSNYNQVRPALYLKPDTLYGGTGTGTWNDPYTIQ